MSRIRPPHHRSVCRTGGLRASILLAVWVAVGCAHSLPPELEQPPLTATTTTAGPNQSMIHLARVESGIVVVDLGWWGAAEALARGLESLGATRDDVVAVFVTHAHRDHVGAWEELRHAPFIMAEPEVGLFLGKQKPRGILPRVAERLVGSDRPREGDVEVISFAADTAFSFGADTVHAFRTPGHTPGSSAYLLSGTLFVGDAVAHSPTGGFQPAFAAYSDDTGQARASLHTLRARLAHHEVRHICTAHARCAEADPDFWSKVLADR